MAVTIPPVLWTRRAKYESNYDKDTVTMLLDQGFGNFLGKPNSLRLIGTNAPELRDPGGVEAKEWVAAWFSAQPGDPEWPFVVETYKPDKYGARWDVRVWRLRDNACLNEDLITFGYAIPMKG